MKKIIHHVRRIREKPEHVRRHILHVSVIACAVVLLILWVLTLGTKFGDENTKEKLGSDLEPFSTLKDNLVGGYKSITASDSIDN